MAYKQAPWYPSKAPSYGNLYFFIKHKTYSINPFDKQSIEEAKYVTLKEARDVSPSYKLFIEAATKATSLSERTIKKILYETKVQD